METVKTGMLTVFTARKPFVELSEPIRFGKVSQEDYYCCMVDAVIMNSGRM